MAATSQLVPEGGKEASNPKRFFFPSERYTKSLELLQQNDLRTAIISGFNLSINDTYVYHAIASVNLMQVQSAIQAGTANGLCDWYLDVQGESLGHPPEADIAAYISIFSPSAANPGNVLKSFGSNAKRGSLRFSIAEHLSSKRYLSEATSVMPKLSKAAARKQTFNPYLEFWAWSCKALKWAGPGPHTANVRISHAVLPIFMHHFGCVVPSREGLEIIKQVSYDGKSTTSTIIDMGSGNGYWTYMLRAMDLPVIAVDNQQSVFRCNWIGDTIIKDGAEFLKSRKGGLEDVLLLVYPVVRANFFRSMLDAFQGDRLIVVGTQCSNGYTAFKDMLVDEWISKERKDWTLQLRIPLPSFAGKDEALYFFQRMENPRA